MAERYFWRWRDGAVVVKSAGQLTQARGTKTFVSTPLASREARHFVDAWLTENALGHLAERADLAVSELAANAALHTIAVTRLGHDPRTRAYAERRAAENLKPKDILRCLKRHIAREMYHTLCADLADFTHPGGRPPAPPPPHRQPRAA